ncbi:chromate efflux transporter [Flammeovirga kamogawensis]|uniref:Chromate efflux transporter n=1 Tax=Flammeovirga kamogawensis TaxID=373891 RepID=A0ABX8GTS0_9BACT|nr:chromate efflux transporter [Flammeovirga kamogawensis]MBB6459966.1 chromate transporter [Flammeovirga kamogawensis]QWG06984.1 chromate efflux transporter [Flammeovirga kamogawensis]TRX68804.1 chromate efflux transporter [Flammeovirga kamogawensis]
MNNFPRIAEVFFVMFKLGCLAFGGPAAHIAMLEEEVVQKRKWMTRDHFLDLVGATNLIPGPNSTEMTMHCGHERAGFIGLIVGGISFIFPAVVLTGILGWAYVTYGDLPNIAPFIYGIKPAVLAIIASAIYKLGKKALKSIELGVLGILTILLSILGFNEITALLVTGLLGVLYFSFKNSSQSSKKAFLPLLITNSLSISSLTSSTIFLTFLKVGAVLYGSGYVLFAYLDAEFVATGILTRGELMDAIAIGQFTPGPVLSTVTFVGYQLDGISGALLATLGIFLPSFILVVLLNPIIPKLRNSKIVGYFLDSVNIASVAIMIIVLFQMGVDIASSWQGIIIAILSCIATFGLKKSNPMWIVLGGSLGGYLLHLV